MGMKVVRWVTYESLFARIYHIYPVLNTFVSELDAIAITAGNRIGKFGNRFISTLRVNFFVICYLPTLDPEKHLGSRRTMRTQSQVSSPMSDSK